MWPLARGQICGRGALDGGFASYSTTYTAAGTQTISIPAGASTVTIECYGAGGGGGAGQRGGGGGYSKKNTYSVSGLTGIYISVPDVPSNAAGDDAFANENSSGGTLICLAKGGTRGSPGIGGAAASGTGDVKNSGGDSGAGGGGGAAGPTGNGGTGTSAGGTAGGGDAGAGGGSGAAGNPAGGGSGSASNGSRGEVKLTWA